MSVEFVQWHIFQTTKDGPAVFTMAGGYDVCENNVCHMNKLPGIQDSFNLTQSGKVM